MQLTLPCSWHDIVPTKLTRNYTSSHNLSTPHQPLWRTVEDVDAVAIAVAETSVVAAVVMATSVPVEEEEIAVVVTEVVAAAEASAVIAAEVAFVATVVVEVFEEIEVEAFAAAVVASRAPESLGKCRLKDTLRRMLT